MTSQLAHELVLCERDIVAIGLKTEEKLQIQRDKMALVRARREEILAAHKALMAEFHEEHTRSLENVRLKAEQEMAEAQEAKKQAIQRQREAEAGTQAAEQAARDLERQAKELHQQLDRCRQEQDRRLQEAIMAADEIVRRKVEATDDKVREHSVRASFIQDSSVGAIEDLQKDVRKKMMELPPMSAERSKFRDLYDVFLKNSNTLISKGEFDKTKTDILEAWHGNFIESTNALNLNKQKIFEAHRSATVPPDRPRSVDRSRNRAEVRLASARGRPLPLETWRPKTAP